MIRVVVRDLWPDPLPTCSGRGDEAMHAAKIGFSIV